MQNEKQQVCLVLGGEGFNVQERDLEKSSGLSCPRAVTDGGKSTVYGYQFILEGGNRTDLRLFVCLLRFSGS